ncbi:thiol:disulfide interchange protein DsbG [Billgrantia diversa]|uniref:thiol:disulfide interchange protein DsbG n=1 Tax=Halomonas sp. MCCC 1A13316 TaxID=2733487 RepID=UPI001E4802F5|nr:thiol:disulfide interchange protein DsbG [Halomonas sp. MCCC 1A13316]
MQDYKQHGISHRLVLGIGTGLALAMSGSAFATDWPAPIEQLEQQGLTIQGEFDAPGGLKGYAGSARGQAIAAYLTPDGEHALVGTLIDAQGRDVSAEALEQIVNGSQNAELWEKMADHHWIRDGDPDAPRVIYTFSDPNCPYCRKFWEDAQPWIESGKVQVRHVMVGILMADSPEKAAALLSAEDPGAAVAEHYRTGAMPDGDITDESKQWVTENNRLMRDAQLFATPVTFYRDGENIRRVRGAPSAEKLQEMMGELVETSQ